MQALSWITGNDTGMSSKALWSHMMTGQSDGSYPLDAADFGRIARLLDQVPEWKPRVPEMAQYNPQWRALVSAWDDLDALYRAWWQIAPHRHFSSSESKQAWYAFRTRYEQAMDEHVRCTSCDKALRGSWHRADGRLYCFGCVGAYA